MCGIFSISLHRSVICASPNPSFDQNQPWWRSATGRCSDDVASQHANAVLIDQGGDARRCDELIDEARRTAVVVLHLKPSRDQVTGDLLRTPGASSALFIVKDRRMGRTVDETILPRRRANGSQPSRWSIFLTGRVVSLWEGLGAARE